MHSRKATYIASIVVLVLITTTASISSANTPPYVVSAISDTLVAENSPSIENYRDLNDVFLDAENGSRLAFTIQGNSNPGLVSITIDADSALDISVAASMTGSAEIIISATDLGSLSVQDTFVVGVTAGWGISGLLFEDADFAGTATDYDGGAGDMGLPSVPVELYDSTGTHITTVLSGAGGTFTFPDVMNATYLVRARSSSIGDLNTPPKGETNADVPNRFLYPLPEMTWGYGAPLYGGQDATVDDTDTPADAGPGDTYVTVTVNDASVANVNMGFAYNLIVNTIDDLRSNSERSQQGSLRQFIKNANGIRNTIATTANSSQFRIPTTDPGYNTTGNGEFTIKPLDELLTIVRVEVVDSVILDATTQPGYAGTPIIELDGSLAGTGDEGLSVSCGRSIIRGFVINRFDGHGIELTIQPGNIIEGNYIGTDVTGTVDLGNGDAGVRVTSWANTIGGTVAAARNVISGNGTYGIEIRENLENNIVQGNYIGTDATGTTALGNTLAGVRMRRSFNNTIGGSTPGARNVISANLHGVDIYDGAGNTVSGNYIGTDVTGSTNLGNTSNGIWVNEDNGSSNHVIGGTTAGAGNVISANGGSGVVLDDSVTSIMVQGNYIGLDASGSAALGNGASGVLIENGATFNTIGGTVAGARNVISDHPLQGVEVQGHNNLVQGNYIGTDAAGMAALGNGQVGIWFRMGATDNVAGGTTPGARNIVSANGEDGVNFGEAGTNNNVAMGNFIGTDATGTGPIPNVERGVRIAHNAFGNTVGGTSVGAGNLIAFNGSDGVGLRSNAGIGNRILGNSIVANEGIGIDLGEDDVTLNDTGDIDTGPNDNQNFPVLSTATATATDVTISGSINTRSNMAVRIEFFASTVADTSGYGEGERYLGFIDVTTDGSGNASFNETLSAAVASGEFITSTATDSVGSTSEFSTSIPMGNAAPSVVAAIPDTTVAGDIPTIANYRDLNDVFDDLEDGSALAFAIESNSAPGIVTVTIDADSALDLSFAPDTTGSAEIIISATDLGSLSVQDTFVVGVTAGWGISGLLFEDADFAGTATDYDGGAGDMGLPSVPVELYDSTGTHITTVLSGAGGTFAFAELMDGEYMVRARSSSIGDVNTPPKGETNADVPDRFPYPLPEMTWGYGVPLYGGQDATVDDTDTPADAGPGDTYVTVTVSGASATNVNMGFAYNLIVNTVDDLRDNDERSHQGSLRQFIKNANGIRNTIATTANSSQFRIPTTDPGYNATGNGEFTIKPLDELLTIVRVEVVDSVILDATTQPGYAGTPIIELDGSLANTGDEGISVSSGHSIIRGFVINRFDGHGIELTIQPGNIIEGNYIGTDVTGTVDLGNGDAGVRVTSWANTIGGTVAAARNVISGNGTYGIEIRENLENNIVQGNYIGTDATGTTALGNTLAGVRMRRSFNNTIGGSTPGARNVISANLHGVDIYDGAGNTVSGNYIGTDVTGSTNLGNTSNGIWVNEDNGSSNHVIGGTTAGAGNVISANGGSGVVLDDSVTTIMVQGNYIGLDASGSAALGNGASGVLIENGATFNTIGGTVAGARNVISDHPLQGVEVQGHNNLVQGNYIGTDATGMVAMGNGQVGIWFRMGATDNVAGGTEPGAGNVLSASGEDGLNFGEAGTERNVAMGNFIGTNATGTGPIPNVERGVRIAHGAAYNTLGGTTPGSGNLVAFNNSSGVGLRTNAGIGNRILGNSIHSNRRIGIDLDEDQVTPNDVGDADTGPNGLQNFPVLSTASGTATDVTIAGSINTRSNMPVRIEFFASTVADTSGYGEGERYLGFIDVTTDGSGNASFNETLSAAVASGEFITSTATDSVGSTSEFSTSLPMGNAAPSVVAAIPDTTVAGDIPTIANYRDLNDVFDDLEDGSALSFTIESNSNSSLMTAVINSDSALDMSVAAGMGGEATIVIRATDSGALFAEDTFVVTVDNVPPGVPEGLAVAYNTGSGNLLTWLSSEDDDFKEFKIYRSTEDDFAPGLGSFVHATTDTFWLDPIDDGWMYNYKVTACDLVGNESDPAEPATATAIQDTPSPQQFALHQNVPNPFNPTTVIRYDVPMQGGMVSLRIYDVRGKLVRTLVNGMQTAGEKSVPWAGKDAHGNPVASGVYFYRLQAPGFSTSRKMVMVQ